MFVLLKIFLKTTSEILKRTPVRSKTPRKSLYFTNLIYKRNNKNPIKQEFMQSGADCRAKKNALKSTINKRKML